MHTYKDTCVNLCGAFMFHREEEGMDGRREGGTDGQHSLIVKLQKRSS